METSKYFSAEIQEQLKNAIREADGNEVFFAGAVAAGSTLLTEITVVARGNENAAPAILEAVQRAHVVIHNHPSGRLKPSQADLEIAGLLGEDGIGFLIVNNSVDKLYEVVPVVPEREKQRLDITEIMAALDDDGPIAAKLPNYESRTEQKQMLRAVAEAFNGDQLAIIEAGTGTGKSLAYLIPALRWAVENKERCVISTNTINLQQQLISKDIPFVNETFGLKARYCLVKGRSNYLCLQKLQSVRVEPMLTLDEEEKNDFQTILEWAAKTEDGSVSDLSTPPNYKLWEKVCAESDSCMQLKCPFYSKCFLFRARRQAASADLLVVNHHLLFSDLAIRRSTDNFKTAALLPPYKRIILDEAHNAEDAASSYFGDQLTKLGLIRLLRRFYFRRKDLERGLLPLLRRRCRGQPGYVEIDQLIGGTLIPLLVDIMDDIDTVFMGFFDFVRSHGENSEGEQKVRLTPKVVGANDWEEMVKLPLLSFADSLLQLYDKMKPLVTALGQIDDEDLVFDVLQFRSSRERIDSWVTALKTILSFADDGLVRWFEAAKGVRTEFARLLFSPLEVGTILNETLYANFATVVFTSATLSCGDNFKFLKERLGIALVTEKKITELNLPSSFDFEQQVLLCIPVDVPDPGSREFTDALCKHTLELLTISQGRAFVLFTSFSLLNIVYNRLEAPLRALHIAPLKQGTEDRHRLFQRFRDDISSTLFATDSFWEGVDAPGETLQMVVLTKLPFRVPTEPIIEARVEAIERNGGNPFMDYTVPQAIIKFKQGFGRLIRKKDDIGVIVVFDKRVVQKFYGKQFLKALPKCSQSIKPFEQITVAVEQFFAQHRKT